MREIKFRALDSTNKWHESMTISKGTIKRKRNCVFLGIGDNSWKQVKPETVGQFTGLKDKNGKEIYDKDLCLINGVIYRIEYIQDFMTFCPFRQHEWEWFKKGNNHFKYCYESSHLVEGTIHFLSQLESYEIEVIGNIYENQELLQGAGDE